MYQSWLRSIGSDFAMYGWVLLAVIGNEGCLDPSSAIVLVFGSTLALMNHSCKMGQHGWCAFSLDLRHHKRVGRSLVYSVTRQFGAQRQKLAILRRKILNEGSS
jgi:hypothetical protein